MDEVQDFIMNYEGEQHDLLNFLYELLMDQPGMSCKISYKVPFFILRQRICYLNPKRDGSVEIAFPRGHQLSNDQGILETYNRKYIKGVVIQGMDKIPIEKLHGVIQEAILLDEIPYIPPYAFKKKKL
jgi:hypothetical protein